MDWSVGEGPYNCFKLWKQQWELLFSGPLVKLEEAIQCKYLLYRSGERGLELFNSWDLLEDEQKVLRKYPHARDKCPAKSAKCHFCKKTGHFANVCLSKKRNVHEVEVKHPVNVSEFSIPESAVFMGPIEITPLTVNAVTCKEKALPSVKIAPSSRRCQKTVTCKIDSGAETNIVPRSLYNLICDPPYKNTSYPQKHFLGG